MPAGRCGAAPSSARCPGRDVSLEARALEEGGSPSNAARTGRPRIRGRRARRAQRGVAVAVRAQRRLRVVHVQAAHRACPRGLDASIVGRDARRRCARRSRWPAGGRSRGTGRAARRRRPARRARASSSKERPRVLPAPAVSSSSSGHASDSASASAAPRRPARSTRSWGSPTVEPGCSTTPSAPIASPIAASAPAKRSTSTGSRAPSRRS